MDASVNKKKDLLFKFDNKALSEPLGDHAKYVKHLADNTDEPGNFFNK